MLQTLLLRARSRLAALAQLVERSFRKAQVTGSSPVGGFLIDPQISTAQALQLRRDTFRVLDQIGRVFGFAFYARQRIHHIAAVLWIFFAA